MDCPDQVACSAYMVFMKGKDFVVTSREKPFSMGTAIVASTYEQCSFIRKVSDFLFHPNPQQSTQSVLFSMGNRFWELREFQMSNTCRSFLQSWRELSSLSLSHDWGIQVYLTCGHLAAHPTSRWVRWYATYPKRIPCNWVQKNNVIHPGIVGFEQFFPCQSVRT